MCRLMFSETSLRDRLPQRLFFENLADMVDLFLGQIANFLVRIDTGPVAQAFSPASDHPVDVSRPISARFSRRKIDARNTVPIFYYPYPCRLMASVDANDRDHTFAVDQLHFTQIS